MPWSWASTSATWTPPCSPATPAASPAPGSRRGGAGGARDESLSFLIGLDNPLDQYFMRHPDFFFGKGFENALVNPDNPYILRAHLLCAAWELAAEQAMTRRYFGDAV